MDSATVDKAAWLDQRCEPTECVPGLIQMCVFGVGFQGGVSIVGSGRHTCGRICREDLGLGENVCFGRGLAGSQGLVQVRSKTRMVKRPGAFLGLFKCVFGV